MICRQIPLDETGLLMIYTAGFTDSFYFALPDGEANQPSADTPAPQTTGVQGSQPSASIDTWYEVARWEGKSTKGTETFQVDSDEWRINWSTEEGGLGAMNFQIFVYNKSGVLVSLVANTIGVAKDTSYMHESGEFYLMFNTSQPYVVIVEAKD